MRDPLNRPTSAPTSRAMRMGTRKGYSPPAPSAAGWANMQETTPDRATMDPTDRSMPSEMMTKAMPMARMPLTEVCFRILMKLREVEKVPPEIMDRAITSTTKTIRMPKSFNWKLRFIFFFIRFTLQTARRKS